MRSCIAASTWAQIQTAYAAGTGLRELARKLNILEGTVLAHAKREGWSAQIAQAKALVLPVADDQASAPSVMEAAALSMAERGQRHVERMARTVERVGPHVETMEPGAILDRIDDIERLDKVARRTFRISDDERTPITVNIGIAAYTPPEVESVLAVDVASE